MKIHLSDEIEFECFEIEDACNAEKLAKETDGVIYSWKTEGCTNWLEKGVSVVDVLGLTMLPNNLPNEIDLPDDEEILS
jgi:hypothetical protein